MSEDAMTVGRVITDVLAGVQLQSNELYNKKGGEPKCTLTIDGGGAITVALKGKKDTINEKINVPHVDMDLEVPGGPYVLAQYVTSRLCHGIGDYFCGMKAPVANWKNIADDIVQCVNLMHTIENPPVKQVKLPKQKPQKVPKPVKVKVPKVRSPETKLFIESVIAALRNSRLKNSGYPPDLIETAKKWLTQMEENADDIPVNVQIDIREIACDKVAVYAKERPITEGRVFDIAFGKTARLLMDHATSCISWITSSGNKVPYGPYKNIVSEKENTKLLSRNRLNTTDNRAGLLGKCQEGGGLEYDAIRTLASGIDVVLFGYGHSGTGKTFSLFGDLPTRVMGSVQLILQEVAHVRMRHVFEEAPGGLFNFPDDQEADYDGHIIRLYDVDRQQPFIGTPSTGKDNIHIDRYADGNPKSHLNTVDGIMAYIDQLTTMRREKLRIRATLNNGQSSRSHLYMVIDVWCGTHKPGANESTARLVVVDLGGIETPDSMIESAITRLADAWKVKIVVDEKTKKIVAPEIRREDAGNSVPNTIFTSRFSDRVSRGETKFKYEICNTISTFYTSMKSFARGDFEKIKLEAKYKKCLMADWVAAYRDITQLYRTSTDSKDFLKQLNNLPRYGPNDHNVIVKVLGRYMDPWGPKPNHPLSENPIEVMYPTKGQDPLPLGTKQITDGVELLKPPADRISKGELVDGCYYSLFHLAALYIEGSYIVESLAQMKDYLRNDQSTPKNASVLTKQILQSLTTGRFARHIMLFTMCPIKMQAEQSDSGGATYDDNFMQPAQFVQDVCSTVA
jgi:hypothetical protein